MNRPKIFKNKSEMPDIQSQIDTRKINIDKVGVKDVRYPIEVFDKKKEKQSTVASINMYVDLPHRFRGTHMSRFIEVLNEYRGLITSNNIPDILKRIKERLNANSSHIEISFSYFIEKKAPVSKTKSLMEYKCKFTGIMAEKSDFILQVEVPLTTLCPCSKEISKQSAHNQRSIVKAQVRWDKKLIWIEDLIELIEKCGSSPVYSLLKRTDEKYVTEHAYDHPMFVEDLVRDISVKLIADKSIIWFLIEAENLESIHNHNAYAIVEWSRNNK